MNVLSLFDGMSCGQIALNRAGFKIENYFACEIDKWAIQITQANYPNTIQLGDVTKVTGVGLPSIDLLIGGSPCQGFSFAGNQLNFEDPRSKLFFEFVRLLKEARVKNPSVKFLLENVKMKKEYQDVISQYLGVEPIEINSALVSAQNRKRLYWTNLEGVDQPEDKDIMLKDIVHENCIVDRDKSHCIISSVGRTTEREYFKKRQGQMVFNINPSGKGMIRVVQDVNKEKCNCLTTNKGEGQKLFIPEATKKGYCEISDGEGVDLTFPNSKTRRGRRMEDKCNCLTSAPYDYNFMQKGVLRKLTPVECERLQTVPDNYTNHVSNSQRYKMLGNGWTVDVIVHILKSDLSL